MQVGQALSQIQGVVEVVDGLRVAGSSVAVRVDRGAALQQGLDPNAVAVQVAALIDGQVGTSIRVGEQLIGTRVRAPADLRQQIAQIEDLTPQSPDGQTIRLAQIANVAVVAGQKQLTREQLAPFIGVTARLEGKSLGSALSELPPSVKDRKNWP